MLVFIFLVFIYFSFFLLFNSSIMLYAFPPEIDIQQSRPYLLERNNNYRIYTVVIIPSSKCEKMRSTSESPSNSSCKLNYSSSLTWSFNRTSWFFLNYRIIIKTFLYRWSKILSFTQNILILRLYVLKSNTVITYNILYHCAIKNH